MRTLNTIGTDYALRQLLHKFQNSTWYEVLRTPIATDSKWALEQQHHTGISRKSLLYPTINNPALLFTDVDHSCSRYSYRTPSSTQLFLTVIHATVSLTTLKRAAFLFRTVRADCRTSGTAQPYGVRTSHQIGPQGLAYMQS